MRDFGAVCSLTMPMDLTREALTTTSVMSSSAASVPVDCANAFCARPAPNKVAATKDHLWNRSNNTPLKLRIRVLQLFARPSTWPSAFYGVHVNDMTCQLQPKNAAVLRVRNRLAALE